VAESQPDILAEFQEFLAAKQENERQNTESEDHDVEIWDEKGRGARVKRSMAKPFLQSLGIDLDPPSDPETDPKLGAKGSDKPRPTSGAPAGGSSTVRKYFVKSPK
jgi:hypothetical protein